MAREHTIDNDSILAALRRSTARPQDLIEFDIELDTWIKFRQQGVTELWRYYSADRSSFTTHERFRIGYMLKALGLPGHHRQHRIAPLLEQLRAEHGEAELSAAHRATIHGYRLLHEADLETEAQQDAVEEARGLRQAELTTVLAKIDGLSHHQRSLEMAQVPWHEALQAYTVLLAANPLVDPPAPHSDPTTVAIAYWAKMQEAEVRLQQTINACEMESNALSEILSGLMNAEEAKIADHDDRTAAVLLRLRRHADRLQGGIDLANELLRADFVDVDLISDSDIAA